MRVLCYYSQFAQYIYNDNAINKAMGRGEVISNDTNYIDKIFQGKISSFELHDSRQVPSTSAL